MNPNARTARVPYRPTVRTLVSAIGALALTACSNMPPRSVQELPPTEYKALERSGTAIIEESKKLASQQDRLREQVEQRLQQRAEPAAPVAPAYDPLENTVVSISMFNADVGQLLWALADELKMNLIVDPQVLEQRQRTSLHLRNVSAREVYNHILDAFDLHGEIRGGALVVGQMRERIFNVDLLNSSTSFDLSTGGDVFGAGIQSAGGGGQSLRGTLTMTGSVGKDNDPYKQLDSALKVILGSDEQAATARGPDDPPPPQKSRYSLDPSSGTLFVRARPSQIRAVEELVGHTTSKMRRQVLVEAQILDVSLNDDFQYGVDWNMLRNRVAGIYGDSPATIAPLPGTPANPELGIPENPNLLPYQRYGRYGDQARNIIFPNQTLGSVAGRGLGISYLTDTFSAALNALRTFGNVKVLSNPSVRVRNGSPAYLSVGSNIRYVTKSTSNFSNTGGGSAYNQSTDIQTDSLFSGVVIGVAPIVHDNGGVELLVHPMQTEVVPGSLELQKFPNGNAVTLPVVNVKGITTTLNLHDGDTVLLGGLIDQKANLNDSGIPGLSDVPAFGKLFGSRAKQQSTRELVLVLRVKVI